jgi:hypothetical protein
MNDKDVDGKSGCADRGMSDVGKNGVGRACIKKQTKGSQKYQNPDCPGEWSLQCRQENRKS